MIHEELGVGKCVGGISCDGKFAGHTEPVFGKKFRKVFQIVIVNLIFFLDELFALLFVNSGKFDDFTDKFASRFGTERNFRNVQERLAIFFLEVFCVSNTHPRRNNQVELSLRNAQPILNTFVFGSKGNIDFKTGTTENTGNFLIVSTPVLVVVRSFKPKIDKTFFALTLVITHELVDNGIHDFFVTEKVVALKPSGINGDDRVTQIAVATNQARNIVADKTSHATGKHNVEVAIEHLERRLDQLIQSLDAAKDDVVFSGVCTRHVTSAGINTALKAIFEGEKSRLLKLATRRTVGNGNCTLNRYNRMRCTNRTSVSGVRNGITLFSFNCRIRHFETP